MANAQTVSIANIPIYHNTPDAEEVLPFMRIYNPMSAASQTQLNNTHTVDLNKTHTVVAQVHQPDIQTTTQNCQNRLYPDLNFQNNQQGMQSNSGPSARHTLYGPLSGDTTNLYAELPDPPLLDDEHLVADVATQQNSVPTGQQVGTLQPHCGTR